MEFDKTRWSCHHYSGQNCTNGLYFSLNAHKTLPEECGIGGEGWGSDIRTKVKSLKIDIAEKTRKCESLLLKITQLVENHKK